MIRALLALLAFRTTVAKADSNEARCGESTCSFYEVDLSTSTIHLISAKELGKTNIGYHDAVSSMGGREILFATNSGIFSLSFEPLGLHISKGKVVVSLNLNEGKGNFFMKPNGVFFLKNGRAAIQDSSEYDSALNPILAVQSGPLLLTREIIMVL